MLGLLFWNIFLAGQNDAEVINCTTGKDELGKPSRISKQGLFRMFFSLLGRISTIDDTDRNACRHYFDAKSSVQDYSVNHNTLFFSLILIIVFSEFKGKYTYNFFFLDACFINILLRVEPILRTVELRYKRAFGCRGNFFRKTQSLALSSNFASFNTGPCDQRA